MKTLAFMTALLAFPAGALAGTPPETPVPPAPEIVEDCGEGCTKTVRKTRTVEIGDAGEEIIREEVEVIELRESGAVEIEVDVESETNEADGTPQVRKKVRIVQVGEGEMTDEMRAEIDEMIAGIETEDYMASGDGVLIAGADGKEATRIIIRQKNGEVTTDGSGEIEESVSEDGVRTFRITPETGGETTVITIRKEKSSKNDN